MHVLIGGFGGATTIIPRPVILSTLATLQLNSMAGPCQLTWARRAQAKGLFNCGVDIRAQAGAWALGSCLVRESRSSGCPLGPGVYTAVSPSQLSRASRRCLIAVQTCPYYINHIVQTLNISPAVSQQRISGNLEICEICKFSLGDLSVPQIPFQFLPMGLFLQIIWNTFFFFIPVFLILSVYPKLKRTEYIIGKDQANYSNPWTFKALKSSVSCRLKYFENQAMAVGVLGKKVCPEVE